jgi:peptidyl-prolyl cis-trans isomerase C
VVRGLDASRRLALGALACLITAGCAQNKAPVFATVGRETLSVALRDYYIEQKTGVSPDQVDPQLRKRLENELIGIAAAADAAAGDAAINHAVELAKLETLAKAAAQASGVGQQPSEQQVTAAYADYVGGLPKTEYHVQHIMVATESMAFEVLRRLGAGEQFASIARTTSADDSKVRSGDLGWISPGNFPQAFVQAVQRLKVGEYTAQPVNTPYGWHVIKLLETRRAQAPPLAEVRAQLIANMKSDQYRNFLARAVQAAAVRR